VFRHIFDRRTGYCVMTMDINASTVTRRITAYNGAIATEQGLTVIKTRD